MKLDWDTFPYKHILFNFDPKFYTPGPRPKKVQQVSIIYRGVLEGKEKDRLIRDKIFLTREEKVKLDVLNTLISFLCEPDLGDKMPFISRIRMIDAIIKIMRPDRENDGKKAKKISSTEASRLVREFLYLDMHDQFTYLCSVFFPNRLLPDLLDLTLKKVEKLNASYLVDSPFLDSPDGDRLRKPDSNAAGR